MNCLLPHRDRSHLRLRQGLTLVEMLIAISLTLVMMGTVASIFASVSKSMANRRSAIEMNTQLAHVRNVLASDLQGATCATLPWQRPESSQGYFEIVEGLYCDFYPSMLTDGLPANGELESGQSTVPLGLNSNNAEGGDYVQNRGTPTATASNGLGDWDDILAFTTRNETESFVGRVPDGNIDAGSGGQAPFAAWGGTTLQSPLAEVVWFAVENPPGGGLPGEAGFRTIYRRALIIAPWIDYGYAAGRDGRRVAPGVLRVLTGTEARDATALDFALAALVAFQERYDISARIEFDATIDGGTWIIKANTLADLTKREHRYEHHGLAVVNGDDTRAFPFPMVSAGNNVTTARVKVVPDESISNGTGTKIDPVLDGLAAQSFTVDLGGQNFVGRPFAHTEGNASVRVMVDSNGQVVHATTGLVPLGQIGPRQSRQGEDLMLSQALAFDVQVYDATAPVFVDRRTSTTLNPSDAGWGMLFRNGIAGGLQPQQIASGAYVDLGYDMLHAEVAGRLTGSRPTIGVQSEFAGLPYVRSQLGDARMTRTYDTWSLHYENNGIDEDGDGLVDEGTNGFDDPGFYADNPNAIRLGVDDQGEYETSPPYNTPLRAVQVRLRVLEPDSGQIREVTVRQHFVPE